MAKGYEWRNRIFLRAPAFGSTETSIKEEDLPALRRSIEDFLAEIEIVGDKDDILLVADYEKFNDKTTLYLARQQFRIATEIGNYGGGGYGGMPLPVFKIAGKSEKFELSVEPYYGFSGVSCKSIFILKIKGHCYLFPDDFKSYRNFCLDLQPLY